jgi:hypothetical protein
MAARQDPQQFKNRTLRLSGWVVAGALALAGNLLGPSPVALWLQLGGAAIFAIATVRPRALRPIHTALMVCLRPFTWVAGWFANSDRRPPGPTSRRGQIANTGA